MNRTVLYEGTFKGCGCSAAIPPRHNSKRRWLVDADERDRRMTPLKRERDKTGRSVKISTALIAGAVCSLALWVGSEGDSADDAPAALHLTILDAATNEQTPARVEVLDRDGTAYISRDALLIGGDCVDRDVPWQGTIEQALG